MPHFEATRRRGEVTDALLKLIGKLLPQLLVEAAVLDGFTEEFL